MAQSRLSVVVTRRLSQKVEDRLSELFDVTLNKTDEPFSREDLLAAMTTADVLVPTLNDRIDADMLAAAKGKLRLIANYGAGYDHINIKAAHENGIMVSNSPANRAGDTADMAITLMLSVMRRFKEGSEALQSGDWQGWSPSSFLGARVGGKKLGILGLGRIGIEVARRARVFGMGVNYHNRKPVHPDRENELGATYWKNLDDMLAEVDVLSITCPLTPKTVHIIDKRRLGLMKPTAFIVNTSRGRLIDEQALTDAISEGRLAGAGLDVQEQSPHLNTRLRDMPNVMLLPHMASATLESRNEMGETVIVNIKTFEDGHNPPNRVVPSLGDR
jgi:glyoxylate reductase